jgi:hypothetical protein
MRWNIPYITNINITNNSIRNTLPKYPKPLDIPVVTAFCTLPIDPVRVVSHFQRPGKYPRNCKKSKKIGVFAPK